MQKLGSNIYKLFNSAFVDLNAITSVSSVTAIEYSNCLELSFKVYAIASPVHSISVTVDTCISFFKCQTHFLGHKVNIDYVAYAVEASTNLGHNAYWHDTAYEKLYREEYIRIFDMYRQDLVNLWKKSVTNDN